MKNIKERWIKYIDSVLLYLVVMFACVMLVAQMLLIKEGTRIFLSKVDKMEGDDLITAMPLISDMPMQITEEKTVVRNYQNLLRHSKVIIIKRIKNLNNNDAIIMVNGKEMAHFTNGDSKLIVYDGDYVEIDGTALTAPETFLIRVFDKGLISPQDGLIIEGERRIFPVGKIKFNSE